MTGLFLGRDKRRAADEDEEPFERCHSCAIDPNFKNQGKLGRLRDGNSIADISA